MLHNRSNILHRIRFEINENPLATATTSRVERIDKMSFSDAGMEGVRLVELGSDDIEPFQGNNKQQSMNAERDEVCVTP